MGSICIKPQPPKVIENLDSKGGSVIDKEKYIIAPKNDEEKKNRCENTFVRCW